MDGRDLYTEGANGLGVATDKAGICGSARYLALLAGLACNFIMGVMDDEFLGPMIWVIVSLVSLCCLACWCNCLNRVLLDKENDAYWKREAEEKKEREERQAREREARRQERAGVVAWTMGGPVLPYDLIQESA